MLLRSDLRITARRNLFLITAGRHLALTLCRKTNKIMVGSRRIELRTPGFSDPCSTN